MENPPMPKIEEVMLGLSQDGRLTATGLSTAYDISRNVDYYTAHTTALLWTEVARQVAMRMAAQTAPQGQKGVSQ